MTCREEILRALPLLQARLGRPTFSPDDVVEELARRGSQYKASTIRAHVTSRMCGEAQGKNAVTHHDLERVSENVYRLRG